MSHSDSYKEGNLLDDDIEMTAMPIETDGKHHSTRENTDDSTLNCLPTSSLSSFFCSSNESTHTRRTSNIADLVSYIGFRGVALLIAFKLIGLVVFAMFFMSYTVTLNAGDVSHVTLTRDRLENLREKIRETTLTASAIGSSQADEEQTEKVLFTLPVATSHVYDRYIEFILSYPRDSTQRSGDNTWESSKDSTSTILTGSTVTEIAATRKADKLTHQDPLSVHTVAPALVVHSFEDVPYTVLLNKFNTVKDHCLLVSNEFAPQISPFHGAELELWHWTLLQTRGVGFYNSNGLAGASQGHRHMQFIPGDAIWSMRNKDSTHALPIDDIVMPPIEAGVWRAFPFSNKDAARTKGADQYKYRTKGDTLAPLHDKLQTSMLHQLKQFDFQHGVAVLLDRSSFLSYGSQAAQAYSDYLQQAYEALLRLNGIDINVLRQCAAASLHSDSKDTTSSSGSNSGSNRAGKGREKEVEHDDLPVTHTESIYELTEPLNCQEAVAYNIVLRPQYMMLVPRNKKDFASAVNINSFGYMGLFLATNDVAKGLIRDVGPLEILKLVGRPRRRVQ